MLPSFFDMGLILLPARVVLDTNIMRAGIRSRRRPEHRCLQLLGEGRVVPLATPALFLEYEEVLSRPETLKATGLTLKDISEFLAGLAAIVEPVVVDFDWKPMLPDADDDMVANCAINGMADRVVTNNVSDLRLIGKQFGIPVVEPAVFLAEMDRAIRIAAGGRR